MSVFNRAICGLAWLVLASGPCMGQQQGGPCTSTPAPAPLQPATVTPSLPTLEAWVDPEQGDDATASPGGLPYRTIQAAVDAVSLAMAAPSQMGGVVLMPGRYGFDGGPGMANGESWPVQVPPGVHIEGLDATSVIIDGGLKDPAATPITLPAVRAAGTEDVVPCFVYGGSYLYGYGVSLIDRVTVVDADIGILVTGDGEIDPTIAESLFMNCDVGVRIHSTGHVTQGIHRPRILWCTFGNCDVGLAMTGEIAGAVSASRSWPAIMNGLFKCNADLEGVPCDALAATAFGATRCNTSAFVAQPAVDPVPVFDADGWTRGDLFLGARYVQGPAESAWFTDWRLTHATQAPGAVANPAASVGITAFPAATPNGTPVTLQFGGGLALGMTSAEGRGTYGPLNGPFGGAPGHIGYRSGGTFLVGGTVPGERRFGPDANGVMYDVIDLHWKTPGTALLLFGVRPGGRPWLPNQRHPAGVLDPPHPMANSPFPWSGDVFIDYVNHPINDFSGLVANTGSTGFASANLGLQSVGFSVPSVWQMAVIDATGQIVLTDSQAFVIGL